MAILNHSSVCMSYTWRHLKDLTQEANFLQRVQSGKWVRVYDNLNIHQRFAMNTMVCIYAYMHIYNILL